MLRFGAQIAKISNRRKNPLYGMTFQWCKGRRQCDSCIPVILVSIDLPLHTCIQVNQLFMKKNIEASKSFYIPYI